MKIEARGHWVTKKDQNKGVGKTKNQDTNLADPNRGILLFLGFISGVLKQEACHTFWTDLSLCQKQVIINPEFCKGSYVTGWVEIKFLKKHLS